MKNKLLKLLVLVLCASVACFFASCTTIQKQKRGCGKDRAQIESNYPEQKESTSFNDVESHSFSASEEDSERVSVSESVEESFSASEQESEAETESVSESENESEEESLSESEEESQSEESVHECEYTELKYNATHHWYECNCGEKQGEEVHSGGQATCAQQAICSECEQAYGETLPHEVDNHQAKQPTCEEIGWEAYETCINCEYSSYEEIPALGHDWETDVMQELSCDTDGVVDRECKRNGCGKNETAIEISQGHSFGEWAVIEAPTCYQDGLKKQVCSDCLHEEQIVLDKLEHIYVAIGRAIVSGNEEITYECSICHDTRVVVGEATVENLTKPEYLFDISSDFTFDLVGGASAEQIRENVFFINAMFKGTEYETKEEVQVEYNLTNLGNGRWRVTPVSLYQGGMTYFVKIRGGLSFADYGGKELTFRIASEESEVAEISSNVRFLRALENSNPGYYPYSVEISEETAIIWLSLNKIDALEIGNILCVGEVENADELLANIGEEIYFGKIEEIFVKNGGGYLLALSCPDMNEVFDELDVNLGEEIDFEGENVEINDSIQEQVKLALYTNDDFLNFAGTMEVATRGYLINRNLNADVLIRKSILDYIKIDCNYKIEGKKITINVDGEMKIPLEYGQGEEKDKLGEFSITFKLVIEASFNVNVDYKLCYFLGIPSGIDYIEVRLERTTVIDFEFDIAINASYELMEEEYEGRKYLLNTKSGVLHQQGCRHVASIKDKSKIIELSSEDALKKYLHEECNPCGTCQPIDAMTAKEYVVNIDSKTVHMPHCYHISDIANGSYYLTYESFEYLHAQGYDACADCKPENREIWVFQERLLNKVFTSDVTESVEGLKDILDEHLSKEEVEQGVEIAYLSVYTGPAKINVTVSIEFNFNFEATLDYDFRLTNTSVFGLRYVDGKITPISSEDTNEEENKLEVIGKLSVRAGLEIDVNAGIVGLDWALNAGVNTDIGLYAKANGILRNDEVADEYFHAVYFEAGIYADVDLYVKVLKWKYNRDFYDEEFPLWVYGFDKAYYSYEDRVDELNIDGDVTLSSNDFLKVKYFDTKNMEGGTETLSIYGVEDLYEVELSLRDGTYCYIENGVLKIRENAPVTFEDVLYLSVNGLTTFGQYIKGSSVFYLEDCEIIIKYDNTGHVYVEVERVLPTCTEEGYILYECQKPSCYSCNGVPQTKTEVLRELGHNIVVSPTVFATCTQNGHTTRVYCSECDYVIQEQEILPAFGHDIINHESKAPSCYEVGWDAYETCFNEGCEYSTRREYKIPHSWDDEGVCTACGQEGSEGLSYALVGGTYTVSIGACEDANIVIPSYYNGVAVTTIGDYAFEYCASLTSVVIGDSVRTIGYEAFYYSSLTSVVIGDSVTTIGDYAFCNCSSLTSVYYNGDIEGWCNITFSDSSSNPLSNGADLYIGGELLTEVVIPNTVTEIGAYAFYNCDSLTSVEIGDSVTTIGEYAFYYCSSLTSVEIPDSVTTIGDYAFCNCSSLTSVEIGDSVRTIGYSAFEYCYKLVEVINNSSHITVENGSYSNGYVGYYALSVSNRYSSYVSKLSNDNGYIIYTEGAEKVLVGYNGEETDLVLPSYVTQIYQFAFYNLDSLTSVEIPDSVTTIGNRAFYSCDSLTSVEIGDSVTTIGDGAFSSCSSLTSVEIGDSVTTIGNSAFYSCDSLTSIVIPNSVTTIGYEAFAYCRNLTSVEIGDSVTTIGNSAFYNCYKLVEVINNSSHITVEKGSYSNGYVGYYALSVSNRDSSYVSKLSNDNGYIIYTEGAEKILVGYEGEETDLVLPDYITQIYQYAFYYLDSLTSVEIGDSVTTIGENAFSYCSSLTSVVIGDSVTTIGGSAFSSCSSLTSVVIGDSVTTIGYGAFYGCYRLTRVEIGESVTTIGNWAFGNCYSLTSVTFKDTSTWYSTRYSSYTGGTQIDVTNPTQNATYLKSTYSNNYWYKK